MERGLDYYLTLNYTNMNNKNQNKVTLIAFFTLWIAILVLTIASFAKPSDASARNDWMYPPRIQQICWDSFIWSDWDSVKKYNNRCKRLWYVWTREETFWHDEYPYIWRSYNSVCDLDNLPEDECKL